MTERVQLKGPLKAVYVAAMAAAALYLAASLYVGFAQDVRPAWSRFVAPVAMLILGIQAVVQPSQFGSMKGRTAAVLFFSLAALFFVLMFASVDSSGGAQ
jgi:hypothetical protein